MAKRKMNCPFSGKGCKECPIYRGRHYFLCFSKRYRGVIGDRAENIEEAMKNTDFFPSSKDEKKESKVSMDKWDKSIYGNETIMIVEDDEYWKDFLDWVLNDTGYTLIHAEGRDAYEIFDREKERIDLVVADSASSGKGILQYAKEKKPEVKTILTTGNYSSLSDLERDPRTTAVIPKPYSSYTLTRTVRDVLDGKYMPKGTIEKASSGAS